MFSEKYIKKKSCYIFKPNSWLAEPIDSVWGCPPPLTSTVAWRHILLALFCSPRPSRNTGERQQGDKETSHPPWVTSCCRVQHLCSCLLVECFTSQQRVPKYGTVVCCSKYSQERRSRWNATAEKKKNDVTQASAPFRHTGLWFPSLPFLASLAAKPSFGCLRVHLYFCAACQTKKSVWWFPPKDHWSNTTNKSDQLKNLTTSTGIISSPKYYCELKLEAIWNRR